MKPNVKTIDRFIPYRGIRDIAVLLTVAFLLCLAALWNGQPFFYPDTPTYLRGAEMGLTRALGPTVKPWLPTHQELQGSSSVKTGTGGPGDAERRLKPLTSIEDKVVLAGRSVYYGALVYAGYVGGGMWLTVALQALCMAYVLQLLMTRLWGLTGGQVVGVAAVLGLLTPAGVYTGFLMPDVFAPLVILTTGLLTIYWRELPVGHRVALAAILLFALCAHSSHVALAGVLLVLLLAAKLTGARWRGLSAVGMAVLAACMVGALAAEWAFGKAVTAAVGAPPLRLPHPMARLIDLGPGTAYLKQRCPEAGYAACAYVQNYPTPWEDFLFSTDASRGAFALADAATKRRMSAEQLRFVADVLRFDPIGVGSGISLDVLRQLGVFGVDVAAYDQRILDMYEGRVPDSVFSGLQKSRAAQSARLNRWLTLSTYFLVAMSAVVLAMWWRRRRGELDSARATQPDQRQMQEFIAMVIAGVVVNAVVCATLASSLARFQARVIWLLPFLALAVLARNVHERSVSGDRAARPATPLFNPNPSALQGIPHE